jgi:hypothetical protein
MSKKGVYNGLLSGTRWREGDLMEKRWGGGGMMKNICIIFLIILLGASGNLVFADGRTNARTTISETILEILSSISVIIENSIAIAEAELKELQREPKKKGDSLEKQAEESIVQTLRKTLAELKKLEKALKEKLAEMEELSRENLDKYRKNRDQLEMRLDQFKERLNALVADTEKRRGSVSEQFREKAIDILEEMKKALNRVEEGIKRQAEDML